MKITILTLFPDMVRACLNESIVKRAQEKNLVTIVVVNLREFALDAYGSVDDRPYGGGAGMVMRIEPLVNALRSIHAIPTSQNQTGIPNKLTILTSAKGKTYNQNIAQRYSGFEELIIIAGHYEGVDARISKYIDEEVSIGDFVMTGGEIAALAIADSVSRLIPGVLKKESATQEESFGAYILDDVIASVGLTPELEKLKDAKISKIQLLEYPHYTRPKEYKGAHVPEVLLNGNHKEIQLWKMHESYSTTRLYRPDLLDKSKYV